MDLTPAKRMSRGYAATDAGRKQRRKLAATFKLNPAFEQLAQEPELLKRMDNMTRITFGSYMAARTAYTEGGGEI
jgi:hypothetical protein